MQLRATVLETIGMTLYDTNANNPDALTERKTKETKKQKGKRGVSPPPEETGGDAIDKAGTG